MKGRKSENEARMERKTTRITKKPFLVLCFSGYFAFPLFALSHSNRPVKE